MVINQTFNLAANVLKIACLTFGQLIVSETGMNKTLLKLVSH